MHVRGNRALVGCSLMVWRKHVTARLLSDLLLAYTTGCLVVLKLLPRTWSIDQETEKKQKADPTLNSTKMVVFSTVVIVQKRPYNASVQPKDMMKVSDNKFQAARSRAVMLSTFLSYNLSEPSKIIANWNALFKFFNILYTFFSLNEI